MMIRNYLSPVLQLNLALEVLSDFTSSISFPSSENTISPDVLIFDVSDTLQDEVFHYMLEILLHYPDNVL